MVSLAKLAKTDQFMSPKECAKFLNVSQACLIKWRREKRGPGYYKLGSLVRYKLYDIHKYLRSVRVRHPVMER